MLITTGRNPGREGRLIARALFLSFPGSRLEGRGRRTLSSLLSSARKRRFSRACTIYREQGKPCSISFISLGNEGEWERLSPEVRIKSLSAFPLPRKIPQSACLSIKGAKAAVLRRLADAPPCEEGEGPSSAITAGASKISFSLQGKRIMELGVSYES